MRHACDTLVAPAPLALRLDEMGLAARMPSLRNVIGLWRAPEQVAASAYWTAQQATLTDVYLFGEAGLFGARRSAEDGAPAPIKPGPHGAPREVPGSSIAGEILLTPKGTLGLRGPMVPVAAYAPPPPPEQLPDRAAAARLCRHRICGAARSCDRRNQHHLAAVRHHGGRRLPLPRQDLQEWARRLGQGALLTALPDRLSGHRLAGPRPGQCARPRSLDRTWP